MSGKRRKYSEKFKRDAVVLALKSDKKIPAIADDLGINRTVLARWCRDFEELQTIKKRRILVVIAVTLTLVLLLLILPDLYRHFVIRPEGFKTVDGPSKDMLSTQGVFKPGGYIEFILKPGIDSIKGNHSARTEVTPYLTGKQLQTGLSFPNSTLGDTEPHWGERFSSHTGSILVMGFTVKNKIDIPLDLRLAGEMITFHLNYYIVYPGAAGNNSFQNYYERIDQNIEVTIDELSPEEEAWVMQDVRSISGIRGFAFIFLLVILPFYMIYLSVYLRNTRV